MPSSASNGGEALLGKEVPQEGGRQRGEHSPRLRSCTELNLKMGRTTAESLLGGARLAGDRLEGLSKAKTYEEFQFNNRLIQRFCLGRRLEHGTKYSHAMHSNQ